VARLPCDDPLRSNCNEAADTGTAGLPDPDRHIEGCHGDTFSADGWATRLRVGDPASLRVAVVMTPQHSVLSLLQQAWLGRSVGSPPSLLRGIRRALRPEAHFALRSLFHPTSAYLNDCALPIAPFSDVSVSEQVAAMRQLSRDAVSEDIAARYGRQCPRSWRAAVEDPQRWLDSMAVASLDAWSAVEAAWQHARPALDRETERIGTAVVRGGLDALLNTLHPQIRYRDGVISVICSDVTIDLGPRLVVLVPMISGPGAVLHDLGRRGLVYFGYPVPGEGSGVAGLRTTSERREDGLSLVLGPLRAAVLRAVAVPTTTGQLAKTVGCSASLAVYHCDRLAQAGLLYRERRGQSVQVTHTQRGEELVHILS
jgi:hypothetical protein